MAAVGPDGLQEVGRLNWQRGHQAAEALDAVADLSLRFTGPTFNEFVLDVGGSASQALSFLRAKGIAAGIDLGRFYPELDDCILTCATETKTPSDIHALVSAWGDRG
jgi:glycine dehydrogenase subunit 1